MMFHVDMDAFYASVEQRDNPQLKGRPVIVGSPPDRRGVVSACSYEARAYGVRSAMPSREAGRLCPQGVFLPVNMERYRQVSTQIMSILASFTPDVTQISIDEAFLDMSGTERLFGPPEQAAALLKARVRGATELAISVGVGRSPYIAKLASDYGKPDGLHVVSPGDEAAFVARLGLARLWGVGKSTLRRLEAAGVSSVKDLRDRSHAELAALFGEKQAGWLHSVCRGEDPGILREHRRTRSVSHETTFDQDVSDRDIIARSILELSHMVMYRMMEGGISARTLQLKLRLSSFETFTCRESYPDRILSAMELYHKAIALLDQRWDGRQSVRLVGVGVISNVGEAAQHELFERDDSRERLLEETALKLRSRYGSGSIGKAAFLDVRHMKDSGEQP